MRRLALHLLGAFEAYLDGKSLSGIKTDKARALLIYLAVERARAHRRQALAGLLWPDYPEEGARANLRHALANLRQVMREEQNEAPFILVEGETLQINQESEYWLDVVEFEKLTTQNATNDDLESAIVLYRGSFLEGFTLKDSPDFDNWTAILRDHYLQIVSKALGKLGEQAAQDEAFEIAIVFAHRRLALEPWQEEAHQQLMRFLALSGQRASALAQYETCKRILKEELNAKPSTETVRLYDGIRDSQLLEPAPAKVHAHIPELPSGTVTFLFTDIEGNTPLFERDPVKMDAAMQIHNAILRQAIEANGGAVFKIIGDEFQAAFSTAPQALAAALAAQRGLLAAVWNELGPLSVRMGFHTGEAHLDLHGDEYAVSHTKNRGHRVMEAAHGGQILLSLESAALCERVLPEGIHLINLGQHRMKGLSRLENLYQVVVPGMQEEFPPLRTQEACPNNLPIQLTSFIGRDLEMAKIGQLLQRSHLVTLTGPGGTGKTRLALQVAGELMDCYPDGVWLVELASVADPELVTQTAANRLGMHLSAGSLTLLFLIDYLKTKYFLMIFDNCEHLIAACARLVDALLHACPRLTILVSSRETLGVEGEIPFMVPPLGIPDPNQSPSLESLAQYEAIRLFTERASTVSPNFALNEQNASAVLQVCCRLDGIPLAIELAAARVKILSAQELARRLDDRFRLLTGGSRSALPRHQTLRASLDWSYELLSDAERLLLQRLSVFAGGWTLEAAEFVGCGGGIEACEVLDLLEQLVNKSLVTVEAGEETRYGMLDTIRQYSQEKLVEGGKAEEVRNQHLEYYVDLAEREGEKVRGPDQAVILTCLEAELDNIRLALAWSLESGSPWGGLKISSSLLWFWHNHGRHVEVLQWLEHLLSIVDEEADGQELTQVESLSLARALGVSGYLAYQIGQKEKAAVLVERCKRLYMDQNPQAKGGLALPLIISGWLMADRGDEEKGMLLFEDAQRVAQEVGDLFYQAEVKYAFGWIAAGHQQYELARKWFEEEMELRKKIGDHSGYAAGLMALATIEYHFSEFQKAYSLMNQSRKISLSVKDTSTYLWSMMGLSDLDLQAGNYQEAKEKNEEALSLARRQRDVKTIIDALINLGNIATKLVDYPSAEEHYSEARRIASENNLQSLSTWIMIIHGCMDFEKRDFGAAEKKFSEARILGREINDGASESHAIYCLGRMAIFRGDIETSRALLKEAAQKRLYEFVDF